MKAIQKIISIFLCITFLVSGLGFTINKMVCLKSGKVKLSLVQMKDCCPETQSSIPVIKGNCCDLTNTSFTLGDFNASQKLQANQTLFVQNYFGAPEVFLNKKTDSKLSITSFTDLPPPLFGRKLLSFISILII